MAYENRIVSTGVVDPATIMRNPKNWRLHPEAQKRAMRGMLKEVGWVDTVKVIDGTDMLVDGHLRMEIALEDKEREIPVSFVRLSEAEQELVLATFDPIAALAGADEQALDDLLKRVSSDDTGVQQLLADLRAQHISDAYAPNEQEQFQSFDEGIVTEHQCPKCGYSWSGKSK